MDHHKQQCQALYLEVGSVDEVMDKWELWWTVVSHEPPEEYRVRRWLELIDRGKTEVDPRIHTMIKLRLRQWRVGRGWRAVDKMTGELMRIMDDPEAENIRIKYVADAIPLLMQQLNMTEFGIRKEAQQSKVGNVVFNLGTSAGGARNTLATKSAKRLLKAATREADENMLSAPMVEAEYEVVSAD